MTESSNAPLIFDALSRIRIYVDKEGMAKNREVTEGVKFKFRGIDDVMNFFSEPMAVERVIPRTTYHDLAETLRKTAGGKENYNVRIACDLSFQSLVDGSVFQAGTFYGEANDTGDKATAKAQSIAYRQGFLLTFLVPLGGSFDPEADEEQAREAADEKKAPVATPKAKAAEPDKKVKKAAAAPTPPGSFSSELTKEQVKWCRDQAGLAGYATDEALFARYRHVIDRAGLVSLRDWLRSPEGQAQA